MILKKYHLELKLPNNFVWNGFINVEAENIEDFPKIPEGEFYIKKDSEGWHGEFTLTNAGKSFVKYNHVIHTGYRYEDNQPRPRFYSTEQAAAWMRKYEDKMYMDKDIIIPLTKAKLEDCIRFNKFTNEPEVEFWEDNKPAQNLNRDK